MSAPTNGASNGAGKGAPVLMIDIRDTRLQKGRLTISSGTTKPKERDQREAAIRTALEAGETDLIAAIRGRRVHVSELQAALRKSAQGQHADLQALRARAKGRDVQLGPALEEFLRTIHATQTLGTFQRYEAIGDAVRRHFTDAQYLAAVTEADARAFLHAVKPTRGRPWAPTNQRQVRGLLARLWTRHGLIGPANVWSTVETPRPRKTRVVFLQPEEWAVVESVTDGTPQLAALALGCLGGLRQGEVVHLRPDLDVDFEKRVVKVQSRKGEFKWRPKTANSERTVPMCATLERILRQHAALGFAGARYFIHRPKDDRPIRTKLMREWTESAFRAAGIKYGQEHDGLTNHSLRHTFATWLLLRKQPVHVVAKLMGDTVAMLLSTYAHLLTEDLESAVTALDLAVGVKTGVLSGESSGARGGKREERA